MLAPPLPSEDLLALAAAGDRAAFSTLAARLAAPALTAATRILGNAAHAEDAVQDALVRLWREAGRFDRTRGAFPAWWRRLLMNICLDSRRRLRPVSPLDDAADVADPAPSPEHRAQAADSALRVQAAMATLPPRQRAALLLFHGEGCTMAEIADALDTTPKAIEGLLTRARSDLRARLEPLKAAL
ncbi:RNA polymerase sigma factor [Sandaracinobacteroides saxicola]|uniref:Sigma-70 family RNA polymerase sigma factor n=1 Tax=Sandaracinobacteroides saxicola TaxID=2759707 RepID=A0A7G5IJV5_9SPHN|nr:sigma-70 family RNA polymerase sigma factor [Sandaracinobacteroides saxicola]QMW23647.1 sigma-70 family RNA polymerase sigma factor [Sandaracinobacteroides saxicola]